MAFNEFGHIIASQENGPLLLMHDRDGDGIPDSVRVYCEAVKSCQGILPLNGEVFVTGVGPEGLGLYRLSDRDRNGTLETVRKIVDFEGQPGEHGPHGVTLGPDGMLYVICGNHTQAIAKPGPGTTLVDHYEGDLVPRYEDPGGHARGIKAPAGTVIRTNIDGSTVERIAGGLRNAYDLVFHPEGGLFVHDSDMEADMDTAWYRPTGLYDITEAGEYGWRSGWALWPEYYVDRLPMILDTGRGSPTGGVCYEHFRFPVRYHNAMFLADWSEGRILAVRLKPNGAGYTAESEVFVKGQPLNITDLDVGPDGSLYFSTGGRGTGGGIYRVEWTGSVPERIGNLGTGVARAIRQPQLFSAWGRQQIAAVKGELGDQWGELVAGVAYSNDNPSHYRTRALDLMQLFGPIPSEDLLIELSSAPSEAVRAKAASMMGLHPGPESRRQLEKLLDDREPRVRRATCEAILRSRQWPESADSLIKMLGEQDRTLAFVARRVLERMPTERWKSQVLADDVPRVRILGGLALINADPTEATAIEVLAACSELMTGFLSDAEFVDTLRVCQVALHRGQIDPDRVATLREQIAEEFPAGDTRMNHELIRLAAYLDADGVAERALTFLSSDAPRADRTLVAMYMQFMSHQWSAAQRFELLKYYEAASLESDAGSLALYLMAVTRDFAKTFSSDDAIAVLEQGSHWPNAALAAIYRLPQPVPSDLAETLRQLDRRIVSQGLNNDVFKRLRTGIIASLASCGDEPSLEYLRQMWRNDPERRQLIAMALAQNPEGENWDYLVRSLGVLDGEPAMEVLRQLRTVRVATDDPGALRQLILIGLRAETEGRPIDAVEDLLVHWTGMERPADSEISMDLWQRWYSRVYPDRPVAELPSGDESKWDLDDLVRYIESDAGRRGDAERGHSIYAKAQCAACHRFGNQGDSVGPDLTAVARRFTRREILESILFPAHVISDQYMSKKVLTLDGKVYVGLVNQDGRGTLAIRDSRNQITRVDEADVDQVLPNNSSIMPAGLLDDLSLGEISDLLAYLGVLPPLEIADRGDNPRGR
ncbi:MAG: heme-binding protein [Planctomycetaceae bacterium]|nr:MAG: heme-binding protein [Planctomycetaceae bacterium]